jgi:hypothetical protein
MAYVVESPLIFSPILVLVASFKLLPYIPKPLKTIKNTVTIQILGIQLPVNWNPEQNVPLQLSLTYHYYSRCLIKSVQGQLDLNNLL